MDTGKLPAYRSSYLLRFHPYPRVKLSVRERITASTQQDWQLQTNTLFSENDIPFTLDQAINPSGVHNEFQFRQRRLSLSSLVIDLAFLTTKKLPLEDK